MQNQYGNYIVQFVCDHGTQEEIHQLATATLGHMIELTCQKYSSNVIEVLFTKASEGVRMEMIKELISHPSFSMLIHHNVSRSNPDKERLSE